MAFKLFASYSDKQLKKIKPIVNQILSLESKYKAYSDEDLKTCTNKFKEELKAGKTLDDILPDAFAVCREASTRVLGMTHYPVQLMGGIALHNGDIAEMATGEGKTLVETLPAYLNALTGKGVHVITVNDYLAKRDSEWNGKLYKWLGLSVGLIYSGQPHDKKKKAYEADITYGTNNEFGFDYLRDNMAEIKEQQVQRGHAFAIIDEIDSILIDEARTPLIISGKGEDASTIYKKVNEFTKTLKCSKIVEIQSQESIEKQVDGDYVLDEKHKSTSLTQSGIKKAEKYFHIDNLMDMENSNLLHYIEQSIKAHGALKKDIDYVVKDNEVLIVDEFTGRIMYGRRFNGGLHQAIEAKEGVKIAAESKTMATVTFQNLFRMYDKMSGMTGTASTEEDEFREIYGLRIVQIPTNKPNQRIDRNDEVYFTTEAKYNAVIKKILACHEKNQPVLVGTTSVEKSEILEKLLKQHIKTFNVLNAKNHEKEAEIVAEAGRSGAVTIATNMAGRGTDIMLGGNPDYMAKAWLRKNKFCEKLINPESPDDADKAEVDDLLAQADAFSEVTDEKILATREKFNEMKSQYKLQTEKDAAIVKESGGLCVIGTERHESRRIDNQLRGRSARQGDPGETIFYLSLEDDLLRLFGGEVVQGIVKNAPMKGDEVLTIKMLTNQIEKAQKKLESYYFTQRKNVLQYDDVMNMQRNQIYAARQEVLDGKDVSENIEEFYNDALENLVEEYLPGDNKDDWNVVGIQNKCYPWLCKENELLSLKDKSAILEQLKKNGHKIMQDKEDIIGEENMKQLKQICLLKAVDINWMNHIDDMEHLKQGIGLRGYGQKDPVIAYRTEGYELYEKMNDKIQNDCIEMMLKVKVSIGKYSEDGRPETTVFLKSKGTPSKNKKKKH